MAGAIQYHNSIEYDEDIDDDTFPEHSAERFIPDRYKQTVTNILSKHCTDIKLSSEEISQTISTISKKKLKDLITKHNNKIFAFMIHPDKSPQIVNAAETIFKKFGHDIPSIKSNPKTNLLKDLQLDASLNTVISEFDSGLKRHKGEGSLHDFMKQLRWMFTQYKNIGEEVMRLETTLFQKIEMLDKLHSRIQIVTSLSDNEALPELIESFSRYADRIYSSSAFEENYKELIEGYKKWNICRQIISIQNMLKNDDSEPQCSICLTEPVANAIVPCGHTFCSNCSKKQNTTCYICRGQIRERIRLFFA